MEQSILLPKGAREAQIARIGKVLYGLPIDKPWNVTIDEYKPKRSLSQNAYLWGCVYPSILKAGGETLDGWLADDLHDHLLGEFAGTEKLSAFGKVYDKPLRRSKSMSKIEFAEYVGFIQQYMAERGVFVPDPDPSYSARKV